MESKNFEEIVKDFEKLNKIKIRNNLLNSNYKNLKSNIKWQYELKNSNNQIVFQCRYDNTSNSKINVFTLFNMIIIII